MQLEKLENEIIKFHYGVIFQKKIHKFEVYYDFWVVHKNHYHVRRVFIDVKNLEWQFKIELKA